VSAVRCGRFLFQGRQRLALVSAATSALLTPGSSSNNSSWSELSFRPTILLNSLQPQPLFQDPDLQLSPHQFLLQLDDLLGLGEWRGRGFVRVEQVTM
jgi:hypothetical protein